MLERSNNFKLSHELNTNPYITVDECAFFSMHVYEDTKPLPEGWSILYSYHGDDGYKGNIYVKDLLTYDAKVVFAHRGTVMNEVLAAAGDVINDIQVIMGKIPEQCHTMFSHMIVEGFSKLDDLYDNRDPEWHPEIDPEYPDQKHENPKKTFINFASTGHSLGAVLSDCFVAFRKAKFPSHTFENPGSKPAVQKILIESTGFPAEEAARILADMSTFICYAYQGGVNIINTCNEQVGIAFRFQKLDYVYNLNVLGVMEFPPPHAYASNFNYLLDYTLDQHKMEKILMYTKGQRALVQINNPIGFHAGYAEYVNPKNKKYWDGYLHAIWGSDTVLAAAIRLKYTDEIEFTAHGYQQITQIYEDLLKHTSKREVMAEPREKLFYPQLSLFNGSQLKSDEEIINDFVLVDKQTHQEESRSMCSVM